MDRLVGASLAVMLALSGCAWLTPEAPPEAPPEPEPEVVEVQVPVPVRPEPPPELLAPIPMDGFPGFVAPDHPDAVLALTREGEQWIWRTMGRLHARNQAWRAWATEPEEGGDE